MKKIVVVALTLVAVLGLMVSCSSDGGGGGPLNTVVINGMQDYANQVVEIIIEDASTWDEVAHGTGNVNASGVLRIEYLYDSESDSWTGPEGGVWNVVIDSIDNVDFMRRG